MPAISQNQPGHRYSDASSDRVRSFPRGKGTRIEGTYQGQGSKHEKVDPSFCWRRDAKAFFKEGRVFAMVMNETAGETAITHDATDYNTSRSGARNVQQVIPKPNINSVLYKDNFVFTQTRRFVVVRQRKEFCYACPIFTYSGRATTKRGVRPAEHGIAYSIGQKAELLPGELGITKASIGVEMAAGEPVLDKASRIYYGIHHPIQYNVKVKKIGQVPQTHMASLIGNWKEEEGRDDDSKLSMTDMDAAEEPDLADDPVEDAADLHVYHPENNIWGYHVDINPHMYHPKHNLFGYHPDSNPHGYHPESNASSYHPTHNPYGYHPQKAPYCYHPHFSPHGYSAQQNPRGFHPITTPHNFHPQSNLFGYHPEHNVYGYHPQYNKHGYHTQYNSHGYHPTHNPTAYHPVFNRGVNDEGDQEEEEEEEEESEDDSSDEESDEDDDQVISH
jgi:hypothetical protein